MEMRLVGGLVLVGYAALAITAARARSMAGGPSGAPDQVPASIQAATPAPVYRAELHPLNTKVTGLQTMGEARFTENGGQLTIAIDVEHASPGIEHWQHFHGFKDNRQATCPTAEADKNGDGIIDLIETEPSAGTTMVPFNADPVAMQIPSDTYPRAGADGSYRYRKTVSLEALRAAFTTALGDRELDLDRRVVFIHGVPDSTALPATVQSLGTIPAQVTLPIACGVIARVAG